MIRKINKYLRRDLVNILGWHTDRKIVVFESDDWGSIRMPNYDTYKILLNKGIRVDQLSYNRYDSLASETDLSSLFEVLASVKDKNGNPVIITANTIVSNPHFSKIKESGYSHYYYEPFTETLKRYPNHANSYKLWKQGMEANIFHPQFHGREHLNVFRWMRALRENKGNVRLAFDFEMFDLSESLKISENSFMESFNYETEEELPFQTQSIIEGTQLFQQLFGYRSKTFIAPCHKWSRKIDQTLHQNGIGAYQGSWFQFEPIAGEKHQFNKVFHYTGQRNKFGQTYLVRNAAFEPSQISSIDYVDETLSRIQTIFRWNKPAIIGIHRLNFIGSIDKTNRERNLAEFKVLLREIMKKWPDVEFLSSDQLVDIMD